MSEHRKQWAQVSLEGRKAMPKKAKDGRGGLAGPSK